MKNKNKIGFGTAIKGKNINALTYTLKYIITAFIFTWHYSGSTRRFLYEILYRRGTFNKFPDFFVQPFKIVVDSWKIHYLIAIHLISMTDQFL